MESIRKLGEIFSFSHLTSAEWKQHEKGKKSRNKWFKQENNKGTTKSYTKKTMIPLKKIFGRKSKKTREIKQISSDSGLIPAEEIEESPLNWKEINSSKMNIESKDTDDEEVIESGLIDIPENTLDLEISGFSSLTKIAIRNEDGDSKDSEEMKEEFSMYDEQETSIISPSESACIPILNIQIEIPDAAELFYLTPVENCSAILNNEKVIENNANIGEQEMMKMYDLQSEQTNSSIKSLIEESIAFTEDSNETLTDEPTSDISSPPHNTSLLPNLEDRVCDEWKISFVESFVEVRQIEVSDERLDSKFGDDEDNSVEETDSEKNEFIDSRISPHFSVIMSNKEIESEETNTTNTISSDEWFSARSKSSNESSHEKRINYPKFKRTKSALLPRLDICHTSRHKNISSLSLGCATLENFGEVRITESLPLITSSEEPKLEISRSADETNRIRGDAINMFERKTFQNI